MRDLSRDRQPLIVGVTVCGIMFILAVMYAAPYNYNLSSLLRFGMASIEPFGGFNPKELPSNAIVLENRGYDGQMYYWVANNLPISSRGLTRVDSPIRYNRVGFPFLAWLLGCGTQLGILWAMIGINLVVPGLTAWAIARHLQVRGINPWWAFLSGFNTGSVLSLYNCLTESMAFFFLILGWLAYLKSSRRNLLAAVVFWNIAILTREQLTAMVLVIALWEFLHLKLWRTLAVLLSLTMPVLWQTYLGFQIGQMPFLMGVSWFTWPGLAAYEYLMGLSLEMPIKVGLLAWSSVPMIMVALASIIIGLYFLWKEHDLTGLLLAFYATFLFCLSGVVWQSTITGTGRIGMGLFLFLLLLMRKPENRALKIMIAACFLLTVAVSLGLRFFPVPSYQTV